jgi:hypothetical protein
MEEKMIKKYALAICLKNTIIISTKKIGSAAA